VKEKIFLKIRTLFFERVHDEAKMLHKGIKKNPSFLFILVGIASIIWLLLRSARKPSRLSYPCQRIASANSIIFISWVSSIFLSIFSRRIRRSGKILVRGGLMLFSVALLYIALKTVYVYYNHFTFVPNAVGQTGSRVVWVKQDGAATGWSSNYATRVNGNIVDSMMDTAITRLAGQSAVKAAWSQLFKNHNGGRDYQAGETFAIKVNFNNSHDSNLINANSKVVNALLRQLIDEVGVRPSDINVYDVSRSFPSGFSSDISSRFPGVKLNTDRSVCVSSGVGSAQLGCVLQNSDYLINMPLLKVHGDGVKISMSLKNHFGSSNSPSSFHGSMYTTARTSSQIVINKQPVIKNKTILVVGDGIYGTKKGTEASNPSGPDGISPWPNSIFVSTDPIALDSVMIDYIASQPGTKIAGSMLSWVQTLYQNAAAEGLGTFDTSSDTSFDFKYSHINLIRCVNGGCGQTSPLPSASASPSPSGTLKPGDANGDGRVDGLDYVIWVDNYGIMSEGEFSLGDFNGDRRVDGLDYVIWVDNYSL